MPRYLWDERLISAERAYALAAGWPLYVAYDRATGRLHLQCARCHTQVTLLGEQPATASFTPELIVARTLRHLVTHHDQNLSGGPDGRRDPAAPAPDPGPGPGGDQRDPAGDRPDPETGRGERPGGAEDGDR